MEVVEKERVKMYFLSDVMMRRKKKKGQSKKR